MATLATLTNRMVNAAGVAVEAPQRVDDAYRLRPLPNEDVYLFAKRIDNSRVRRELDPQGDRLCWQWMVGLGVLAVVLVGLLLPSAYSLLAGYRIESLQKDQKALREQHAALDLEIASLQRPAALLKMAGERNFAPPSANDVVYLNPQSDGNFAMNTRSH